MNKILRISALTFFVGSVGYYLWYGLGNRGQRTSGSKVSPGSGRR